VSLRRTWLLRHDGFLALLVYLLVALIWYRSVLAHMGSHCACGVAVDPGDTADFVWWFEWFVHALGHGLPLMHTTVIWTPTGINMAETTASLLLAAVASPFTLLFGPIVSYNLVMMLAPVVSGWGANRLCRELTGNAWASLIAGATYGFSSYEAAHLVGHPQMVVAVCPPLAALCVIRLLKGTVSSRRFLIQLSLLLIAQILLSTEVMFTGVIVGALTLAFAWATGALPRNRETAAKLGLIVIALVVAGVACSWYEFRVLTAPTYSEGAGAGFPTDFLSFLIPMPETWFGGAQFTSVSQHFKAGWSETSAYLGLPLLVIIGHYLATTWRARSTKALALMLGVLVIWILGPTLYLGGKATIPLPYALVQHLPLLSETMQGRITLFLSLVAAVTLALWLSGPHTSIPRAWGFGVLALVAVLPNLAGVGNHNVGTWSNPRFFSTKMYQRYIKPGDTVLPFLWGSTGDAFMWQAEDHMYWNQANGDWVFSPVWKGKIANDLWMNDPHAGDGPLLKAMIIKRRVSEVVIQDQRTAPYPVNRWRRTVAQAGLKVTADVGGVTVYDVPSAWLKQSATR
jgi:hypothetical protein